MAAYLSTLQMKIIKKFSKFHALRLGYGLGLRVEGMKHNIVPTQFDGGAA